MRILEATLEAVGKCGLRKLGMNDVARAAGVSRGTLYRYFRSKGSLLDAIVDYERHRFQHDVNDVLATVPPGQARLEAHIGFVLRYLREHPALANLIETEPRYLLTFLDAHFDTFRWATGLMLEPILRDAPIVRRDDVSFESLSDLIFRLLLSFFLFPPNPKAEATSLEAVAVVVRELTGVAAARPRSWKPAGVIGRASRSGR